MKSRLMRQNRSCFVLPFFHIFMNKYFHTFFSSCLPSSVSYIFRFPAFQCEFSQSRSFSLLHLYFHLAVSLYLSLICIFSPLPLTFAYLHCQTSFPLTFFTFLSLAPHFSSLHLLLFLMSSSLTLPSVIYSTNILGRFYFTNI